MGLNIRSCDGTFLLFYAKESDLHFAHDRVSNALSL